MTQTEKANGSMQGFQNSAANVGELVALAEPLVLRARSRKSRPRWCFHAPTLVTRTRHTWRL